MQTEDGELTFVKDRMGEAPVAGRRQTPGDPGDWIRLAVRQYEKQLVAYATHLVGDAERGRDIAQEAFLRLCSQERGRVEPHLAEWLFHVCRNLAMDVRRKERRMNRLSDEHAALLDAPAGSPAGLAERADAVIAVTAAMRSLSANQQEVIRLKFQHGLSYKEISAVTGLTVTNVGFLIHAGLKSLRGQLADENP